AKLIWSRSASSEAISRRSVRSVPQSDSQSRMMELRFSGGRARHAAIPSRCTPPRALNRVTRRGPGRCRSARFETMGLKAGARENCPANPGRIAPLFISMSAGSGFEFRGQFLELGDWRRAGPIAAHICRQASAHLQFVANLLRQVPGCGDSVGVRDKNGQVRHIEQAEPLDPFAKFSRVAIAYQNNFGRAAMVQVDRLQHVRKAERLLFDKLAEQAQRALRRDPIAL